MSRKVLAKIKKMAITMPDDDNPYGTITGTFVCSATENNMVGLKGMGHGDILIVAHQPNLFEDENHGD